MSPSEALQVSEGGPAHQSGECIGAAHQSGERVGAAHQSGERVGATDPSEGCIGAPHQPETEIKASDEQNLHNGQDSHQQAQPVEEADTDQTIDRFSDLPAELISAVASHLNLPDKMKLRLVLSKSHQPFVDDILKSDLKRVYVTPTTRSLRTYKKICNNAYFKRFIKEVCFVAVAWGGDVDRVIDPDLVKKGLKALETDRPALPEFMSNVEEHKGPTELQVLTAIEEYRPQVYVGGPVEMQWVEENRHWEVVQELAQGMLRLPGFERAMMSRGISGPGLNNGRCWHSAEWSRFYSSREPEWNWKQSQIVYDWLASTFCSEVTEGTSAFLEALARVYKRPISLSIGNSEPNDQMPFFLHDKLEAPLEALSAIGPNLVRLSLHIATDTLDEDDGTGVHIWQILSESAKNLEVLSVSNISWPLKQSYAHQSGDACKRAVDIILEHGNFPKLRELTLAGEVSPLPGFLDAEKLLPFLRRHRSTLQSVSLDRLCLLARSKLPEIAPVMESSLRTIREEMGQQLVKFQLNIVSRTHNGKGRCLGSEIGEDGVRQCHRTCQEYDFECFWVDRAVFEALAGQMGVVLTEDGSGEEVWQFGEYVLRR